MNNYLQTHCKIIITYYSFISFSKDLNLKNKLPIGILWNG